MNDAARISQLEARLERLEATVHTRSDVSGWAAAARVLGISVPAVKRRWKSDPSFPRPVRTSSFKAGGARRMSPEWRLRDLLAYKA